MTRILGIDPGDRASGWCVIDAETYQPVRFGKVSNEAMRGVLASNRASSMSLVAIEMIASYGMPVGREIFETCVWIGRFIEIAASPTELVYRREVKLHHCHSVKATDANVKQALVDRFASGVRNHGKGTKDQPGWFYGFYKDVWSAYAIAVYVADTEERK